MVDICQRIGLFSTGSLCRLGRGFFHPHPHADADVTDDFRKNVTWRRGFQSLAVEAVELDFDSQPRSLTLTTHYVIQQSAPYLGG